MGPEQALMPVKQWACSHSERLPVAMHDHERHFFVKLAKVPGTLAELARQQQTCMPGSSGPDLPPDRLLVCSPLGSISHFWAAW